MHPNDGLPVLCPLSKTSPCLLWVFICIAFFGTLCACSSAGLSSKNKKTKMPLQSSSARADYKTKVPAFENTKHKKAPFYLWPLAALIRHHREVTTKMDGPRCPLYPTCSAWGQQILEKKGALGVFYIIDRLFYREFGPLHKHYVPAPRRLSNHLRYYDPIEDGFSESEPSLLRDDF